MKTFLHNTASGEIHQVQEGHLPDVRCGIEDAREARHIEEISEEEALATIDAEPSLACGHCWEQHPSD